MSTRFAGKTVIVTGASAGIGLIAAKRFGAEGAHVVGVSRNPVAGDPCSSHISGDVGDPATAARAVGHALDTTGRLDVLVNNAGVDFTGPVYAAEPSDIERVFRVNTLGAVYFLQAAARAMEAGGGGAIVNVTSRLASAGLPDTAIYSASKGAIQSLTLATAVELAPNGIRVNAVAPGLTATPLLDAWIQQQDNPDAFTRAITAHTPQGRVAKPEEVASAILFLAADEASHITGATVPVDGGYTAA